MGNFSLYEVIDGVIKFLTSCIFGLLYKTISWSTMYHHAL